ncbi:MAG: hypothetical protein HZA68_12205 [Rhodovulum sp.]|nr:hypothetical protein [Rhodovulum sp.]
MITLDVFVIRELMRKCQTKTSGEPKKNRGGRPATGQTPAIGVRLPAPVRTAAERSAARAGVSLSERIRIAIERDIAEHG